MQDLKTKAQTFKDLECKLRKELRSDVSKKMAKNITMKDIKGDYHSKQRTAYDTYYNNRLNISEAIGKHKSWCSDVRSEISNILRERQLNKKYGASILM